jgi:NhaA family Na+:H+ antiporter
VSGGAEETEDKPGTPALLFHGSSTEERRITVLLRKETVGGSLLLVAAVGALLWANSPWSTEYFAVRDQRIGPAALNLDLSVGSWSADGLLAIFFFVVGLELKREFVAGDLRDPRRAALPVCAAVGGMLAPAMVYLTVNLAAGSDTLGGWAIPTPTDIAFALAVIAVVGTHLPSGLRTFLLTLAVVDDLLAVTTIAVVFTDELRWWALVAAIVPLAAFGVAVQRRITTGWLLVPLAVVTWLLVHESGVHATVAGVLLGFTVPVLSRHSRAPEDASGLAEHLEHRFRPISAGLAVPVFAFFAAGVTIGGLEGLRDGLGDPVALGIVAGLVGGKLVGIGGTTWLVARLTRAELDDELRWLDVLGVALLGGVGFTVSLLIGELAFGASGAHEQQVKLGVLGGSLVAAVLAAFVLGVSNSRRRRTMDDAARHSTDVS